MKFYSLQDRQLGGHMNTGRNSESLEELRRAILSYLSGDTDEDEMEKLAELPVEELANVIDCNIEESEDLV